ncbi:hypothetical protein [Granulicella sp. L60]|uniref:hypothetical protein n=1 Tax=Granulicella sp. L60 TaxID=1641866 RepID=UPI00131D80B4|nr:hypothetical protein [Granulicella sp. L60]
MLCTVRSALGAILILGGASFIAKNFLIVLAPQYDLPYVIAPMFLAMDSLTFWSLIKGVDRARWDARGTGCQRAQSWMNWLDMAS